MSIEAMKQALEALSDFDYDKRMAAITALRQAIAEAEKQEPVQVTIKDFVKAVEGKEDIPEVVEPLKYVTKQEILTSNLDFDKLIADLKNAEQIWNQHVETDDEEILLLL